MRPIFRKSFLLIGVLLLAGCNQIWNAGDLAEWVAVQAGNAGCDPSTIELDEWYVATEEGNVWSGTCVNATTGEDMPFGINVDSVWTPSEAPADDASSGTPMVAAMDKASTLAPEALANATYSGILEEPITLVDGYAEDEPFVEGDAARPTVEFRPGSERYGDLDGDGVDDAIVFLMERGGGTGAFVYVAAQLNQDGQPADAGAVRIEDRIQVISAEMENGQVELEVTVEGPGDAACCRTHRVSKTYALEDGRLTEVASGEPPFERISAADLDGSRWTLVELGNGEALLADTPITLQVDGGALSGSGGCNDYRAGFTLDEVNPFIINVEAIVATRKACPPPITEQETAYFQALEGASLWGYDIGRLGISYYGDDDGPPQQMRFAPMVSKE